MYPSTSELTDLYDMLPLGACFCTVLFENEKAVDLIYDYVNPAFYKLTGLSENVEGQRISAVIPNLYEVHPTLLETYGLVVRTGHATQFEIHIKSLGVWLSVYAAKSQTGRLIAVFENITGRKAVEAELDSMSELTTTIKAFRTRVAEV